MALPECPPPETARGQVAGCPRVSNTILARTPCSCPENVQAVRHVAGQGQRFRNSGEVRAPRSLQ